MCMNYMKCDIILLNDIVCTQINDIIMKLGFVSALLCVFNFYNIVCKISNHFIDLMK